MRIRLYRSNANSDSTGSDLLSRIEDYDSPPPPKRCFSPQRRLKRWWRISYREANTRNTATPLSDAREYSRRKFLFSPPSSFSPPVVSTPVTYVARKIALPPSLPHSPSLFSKGNSALVSWSLDKSRLTNERSFRLRRRGRRRIFWLESAVQRSNIAANGALPRLLDEEAPFLYLFFLLSGVVNFQSGALLDFRPCRWKLASCISYLTRGCLSVLFSIAP